MNLRRRLSYETGWICENGAGDIHLVMYLNEQRFSFLFDVVEPVRLRWNL
jgi:hypothetical protein